IYTGPWDFRAIAEKAPRMRFGVAPLPAGLDGRRRGSVQGGGGLFVPHGAAAPALGVAWVRLATGGEYAPAPANGLGRYPAPGAGALEQLRRHLPGYLFAAPALGVLGLFVFLPLVTAVGLSFTSWNAVGPVRFAGLSNYVLAFTDPTFAKAIANTLVYTVASS